MNPTKITERHVLNDLSYIVNRHNPPENVIYVEFKRHTYTLPDGYHCVAGRGSWLKFANEQGHTLTLLDGALYFHIPTERIEVLDDIVGRLSDAYNQLPLSERTAIEGRMHLPPKHVRCLPDTTLAVDRLVGRNQPNNGPPIRTR